MLKLTVQWCLSSRLLRISDCLARKGFPGRRGYGRARISPFPTKADDICWDSALARHTSNGDAVFLSFKGPRFLLTVSCRWPPTLDPPTEQEEALLVGRPEEGEAP